MNPFFAPLGIAVGAGPSAAPAKPKYSKGQIIAGILADALAGAAGQQGPMLARWDKEREQENQQAQWSLKRKAELEDYEKKQQIEQRYKVPEVPSMLRDVQAYLGMTPEQKAAWDQMNEVKRGDPDVFITLPNGQVYAGPKSGLAAAMMGGAPQSGTPPPKPVGRLTPINGGSTPQASSTFPDPMKAPGTMTSGRRTPEGNRLVGGARNSNHLRGDAADYVGTSRAALQQYFGPGARIGWHRNHWHTDLPGFGGVPYYGKRGTTGLKGR